MTELELLKKKLTESCMDTARWKIRALLAEQRLEELRKAQSNPKVLRLPLGKVKS